MSVDSVLARLEKKAGARVAALALELQSDWRETLSQPGKGRTYGNHTASAPGDAPAVDSGLLRNSLHANMVDPLTWEVGFASVPYPDGSATTGEVAVWMEYGYELGERTRVKSKRTYSRTVLAPRPHARPTLDNFKAKKKGKV